MGIKHVGVQVRISRRTMWVGSRVYPLAHVTRVEPLELVPRRGRMLMAYGREAGSWLALGLIGLMVLTCAGDAVPGYATAVYALVVLAALTAVTVRLVRRLTRRTLYVLTFATSGTAHEVVANWDRDQIYTLMDQVIAAIDDPDVSYAVRIDNIDISGDAVFGNKSGDIIHGDKHSY